MVITLRPLSLSASNFVGSYTTRVSISTPSGVTIALVAQVLLSDFFFQDGRGEVHVGPVQGPDRTHLAKINSKATNMAMEFDIFQQSLEFVLTGMEIPKEKWYLYILQQLSREGWSDGTQASKTR